MERGFKGIWPVFALVFEGRDGWDKSGGKLGIRWRKGRRVGRKELNEGKDEGQKNRWRALKKNAMQPTSA